MWATNSDASLSLTHRQVFPFNIIIMYMRTKYTGLLSIISQSIAFSGAKIMGPELCQYRADASNIVLITTRFYDGTICISHAGPDMNMI